MKAMMEKMMKDWMKNFDGLKYAGIPSNMDFMKDMNMSKVGHQLMNGQKSVFNNTYEMLLKIQEQTEKIADSFMRDYAVIPTEGLRMLDGWRDIVKKGQSEYKKAIDKGFEQLEALLTNVDQFKAPKAE
jgi:hypothetical protein